MIDHAPHCLAAWTAPTAPYPEYVSVNVVDERIEITVRSERNGEGACRVTAMAALSGDEFKIFMRDLIGQHARMVGVSGDHLPPVSALEAA